MKCEQFTRSLSRSVDIKTRSNFPVKDKQGNLLTSEQEQNQRWVEHFSKVLNRPDPKNPPDIAPSSDLDINTDPPTREEIIRAVKTLKNNKAPGQDAFKAELFKMNPELVADDPSSSRELNLISRT